MRAGGWKRKTGFMLKNRKCGIAGFGRVGQATARLLQSFGAEIKARDTQPNHKAASELSVEFLDKKELLEWCDVLFLCLPLTEQTKNYISKKELETLGQESVLINTSRGNIVGESDLEIFLKQHPSFFAAMDVFAEEPYQGSLSKWQNFLGTCHMGASTRESRQVMEMSAASSVASFLKKEV
jgi:D-3-phosphoglycerate dehydrogenase